MQVVEKVGYMLVGMGCVHASAPPRGSGGMVPQEIIRFLDLLMLV